MSTQAIRSVILRYKEALGDDVLPGQADAIRLAIEEVEAIEQACRDWYAQETRRGVVLASDALAPFERIALETKP